MLQDHTLMHQIKTYKTTIDKEIWVLVEKVLRENPEIFPERFVDKHLFFKLYGLVCTRCFGTVGYLNKTAALVPMADNFNHNCVEYLNTTVCLSMLHKG